MKSFLTESEGDRKELPRPPIRERRRIFVHQDVDNLGLDPYEFRVYGHIARRGSCFASLDKIAATCCMSVRKVQYVLKVLEQAELIHKETRKGRVSTFRLTKPSRWLGKVNKEALGHIRILVKGGSGRQAVRQKEEKGKEKLVQEGQTGSADDVDTLDSIPF